MKSWTEWVNLACMLILMGPLVSYLFDAIKRVTWSTPAKQLVLFALCAVLAAAERWLAGDILNLIRAWGQVTAADIMAQIGLIYAGANVWYKSYLQH